ncbi:MAG TPA: hypothetical protein VGA99_05480, partial [bacterium]
LVIHGGESHAISSRLPTSGTVRALVFFVRFNDVVFSPQGCHQGPHQSWPDTLFALPEWADDLIDETAKPPYTPGSISDFFHQMSNGKFHLIGDIHSFKTDSSFAYWESQGRGALNKEIINQFDAMIDYSGYDADDNGEVDLIIFIYRFWKGNFPGFSGSGIANLGFTSSVFHDGVEIKGGGMGGIGSGITRHNSTNLCYARQLAVPKTKSELLRRHCPRFQ